MEERLFRPYLQTVRALFIDILLLLLYSIFYILFNIYSIFSLVIYRLYYVSIFLEYSFFCF